MDMKVISCFSYKGGAGRSTLVMNVIPFLAEVLGASEEHPLILVDMDIDSCGLTFLYDMENAIHPRYNVQSLFGERGNIPREDKDVSRHNLFTHMVPVGQRYKRTSGREILCLPAMPGSSLGAQGSSYDGDYERCQRFINECRKVGCCGIVFDSAVGDQLTARWSNKFASHIICCMRPTKQFREGTKRYFDQFDDVKNGKIVIVVPNVVPTEELTLFNGDEALRYPEYAREQILSSFADNIERNQNDPDEGNRYIMDVVEGEIFGIPKIDRFMWQEGVLDNLAKEDLTDCERAALQQYRKIANLIAESRYEL